jgi:uncharacterized protein
MLSIKKAIIIGELINRASANGLDIGKIQLQKLVYFLQFRGVNLGYRYTIYHFGPYSAELTNDLETMDSIGFVRVQADPMGYGYHITPGEHAPDASDLAENNVSAIESELSFVLSNFGDCDASQIELKATIHYVHHLLSKGSNSPSLASKKLKKKVVDAVRELKPKFAEDEIDRAHDELRDLKLLS